MTHDRHAFHDYFFLNEKRNVFHENNVCSYSKRADATEDLADAIEVFSILVLLCFVP